MTLGVERLGRVVVVELRELPHNFLTPALVEEVAGALEDADRDPGIGCAVLAAEGRSFCAGANFGSGGADSEGRELIASGLTERLYAAAARGCARSACRWWRPCTARRSAGGSGWR